MKKKFLDILFTVIYKVYFIFNFSLMLLGGLLLLGLITKIIIFNPIDFTSINNKTKINILSKSDNLQLNNNSKVIMTNN